MELKLNVITLLSCFFFVITLSVIQTEKIDPVNFVVFHDAEDQRILNVIDIAVKHYKEKLSMGEVHRIPISTKNIPTRNQTFLKLFKNIIGPSFALDLTKKFLTGILVQNISKFYKFPTVSTNKHNKYGGFSAWQDINKTMHDYLIYIRSPETIIMEMAMDIVKNGSKKAFIQSGTNDSFVNTKWFMTIKNGKQLVHYNGFNFLFKVSAKSFFSDWKRSQETREILIIDNPNEAVKTLDNLSNINLPSGSLFDIRYTWFYVSTNVHEEFECPDYVQRIFLLKPELKKSNATEEFETKDLSDLFYFDVIRSVVQTYTDMKKRGDWNERKIDKSSDYELDLRENLKNVLSSESNILGKFKEDSNKTFEPSISFKLELNVGPKINLQVGDFVDKKLVVKNRTLWNNYYLSEYINVWTVSDPPFVIRNETCLTLLKTPKTINCFSGFVIDLIHKIQQEHRHLHFLVESEAPYGKLMNSTHWSGAIGALQDERIDMGIGAFAMTLERFKAVDFSKPFFFDTRNNQSYSFAFQKGKFIKLQSIVYRQIAKYKSQRYTEQLKENWFVDYKCNCTLSKEH